MKTCMKYLLLTVVMPQDVKTSFDSKEMNGFLDFILKIKSFL